jgi:hypothetical protein
MVHMYKIATSTWATTQGTMFSRRVTVLTLLFGPLLTMIFLLRMIGTVWLTRAQLPIVLWVALVFWSPLFFSIPALLLQDVRDSALDHWRGPVLSAIRGLVLLPYLVFSPKSPARLEAGVSLLGFAIAVVVALPALLH